MSHNAKHCHFSAGSHMGSHHTGGYHSAQLTSHHGGSHMSHHGGSSMFHHGGPHTSHHGGHNNSHHGGSHMSSHGGHHMSHHEGSHISSHHGGSHKPHHGGHHMSHQGGHHMSHLGGSHMSSHGGHHMSHHAGSHMSSHGGHHMSHHGGNHMTHHGGSHMSHHGSHHTSHHGSHHKSHHGGSQMSHHGGSHMSSHGGHHMSHHGGSHMSGHGGAHMSHHGGHHMSHHGGNHMSHHGSHHKKEVSFSKHVSHGHDGHHSTPGGHGGWSDSLFGVNEKETMQLLNERLSSYLNKVRSLEIENTQLEGKICEWYANHQPKTPPDGTHYFRLINELQNQIAELATENARILLETDNARLAADDYNNKSKMEDALASNVEMDVKSLGRVLEGLSGEASELGTQVESLQEEMDSLRNNSEAEIESLLSQLGARINIQLDAAPSTDLNEALSEIREEYENLMERNLKETEYLFLERSQELTQEVESGSEELQSIETELIEMKRCMQALEIELQSELSLKSALEGTLAETEATFGSKLAELQCLINGLESDLAQIRSDLEHQNQEYMTLMDQKTHLEMEIATYKRLLDGHDIDVSEHHMSHDQHGYHHSRMYHHSGHHDVGHHMSGHQHGGHHSFGHHHGDHQFSGHFKGGHHSSHQSGGH
ncbi:keratin, type I cytoskeletal 19-like [Lithobates pipiens]